MMDLLKVLREFGPVPFSIALLGALAHLVYIQNEIKKALIGMVEKVDDHSERISKVEGRMDPGALWTPRAGAVDKKRG